MVGWLNMGSVRSRAEPLYTEPFTDTHELSFPARSRKPERVSARAPAPEPPTPDEAELAARVAPLLDCRPYRTPAPVCTYLRPPLDFEHEAEIAQTWIGDLSEACSQPAPPLLAYVEDDPGVGALEPPTVPWLERSRKARRRERLAAAAAWSVTSTVVIMVVGMTSVALMGPTKSLAIAEQAGVIAASTFQAVRTRVTTQLGV
jgi:hypothetical protein